MTTARSDRIRELNDAFRTTLDPARGRVMVTAGVHALGPVSVIRVLHRVRTFDDFTADNDPYIEHDFGAFTEGGQRYFWKVDYYDLTLEGGSPDPADPAVTTRVLTIMLAEEY